MGLCSSASVAPDQPYQSYIQNDQIHDGSPRSPGYEVIDRDKCYMCDKYGKYFINYPGQVDNITGHWYCEEHAEGITLD